MDSGPCFHSGYDSLLLRGLLRRGWQHRVGFGEDPRTVPSEFRLGGFFSLSFASFQCCTVTLLFLELVTYINLPTVRKLCCIVDTFRSLFFDTEATRFTEKPMEQMNPYLPPVPG